MNTVEKILIPSLIILGFIMLIFVGIKVLAIDRNVTTISTATESWEIYFSNL